MKKFLIILISLFLVIFYISSSDESQRWRDMESHNIYTYDKKSRDIFQSLKYHKVNKKGKKDKEKIVLLSLKPINVELELADSVMENFTYLLSSQKILQVVDLTRLSKTTNDYGEDLAIKQANFYNAPFAIIGSITGLGEKYSINVQVLYIQKDKQLDSESVLALNVVANTQGELFNKIKELVSAISTNETVVKKFRKELETVIVFDFESNKEAEDITKELTENIIYTMPDYNKYWAMDSVSVKKIIKKLGIKDTAIDKETMIKIAKEAQAKLIITGSVTKNGENVLVETTATDVETGKVYFTRKIKTELSFQMPIIGEKICQLVSDPKEKLVVEDVYDIDQEKYKNIIAESKKIQTGLLAGGSTLIGLGGGSLIAGFTTLGIYFYDLNNNIPQTYLVSTTLALLCAGGPSFIIGIILDCISLVYNNRVLKYQRFLNAKKISYMPVLDGSFNDVKLGLSMKF